MQSSIILRNCTFVNNTAKGCSDSHCLGGALFIDSGCTVTAELCEFTNNTSVSAGGAIALFQASLFNTQNVFSSNKAGLLGGAIVAYDGSNISIYSCHYTSNMADKDGVISAHSHSIITVDSSSFDNNKVSSTELFCLHCLVQSLLITVVL